MSIMGAARGRGIKVHQEERRKSSYEIEAIRDILIRFNFVSK